MRGGQAQGHVHLPDPGVPGHQPPARLCCADALAESRRHTTLSRRWCMKSNSKLKSRHLLLLRGKSLKIRPSKPDAKMEETKPKNAGA